MHLIVCVDQNNGMSFNRRRQSRDRTVPEDVMKMAQGATVRMEEVSASLFSAYGGIMVSGDFLEAAQAGDYCFAERLPLPEAPETLILYRWNRVYPGDVFLDFRPEAQGMTLVSSEDFSGSSHKRITREIWRKHHGETQRP